MEMLNCDKLSKTSRAWRYEKGFENMLLLRLTGERERERERWKKRGESTLLSSTLLKSVKWI